jgi:hypothetical protein
MNLIEIEIDTVKMTIGSSPGREFIDDIRDRIKEQVVQNQQLTVPARDHVLLEKIGAHAIGQRFRC